MKNETKPTKPFRFGTLAIHAGQNPEPHTGAVMVPIFQTSTYAQESPGKNKGYEYARTDNPTRTAYQNCVAELENGKRALAFSSGVAAIDSVLRLLNTGDHVICSDDVYGGTYRLFDKILTRFGITFSYMDLSDISAVKRAIQKNTRLLWIETPTNPMLKIFDIRALSTLAKEHQILSVVDNTFMSPYFQRPLELGADLVMHSVTKYMNGHSDVIGGILVMRDEGLYDRLKFIQKSVGAVPGPMDCFLVMRGLKTLHVRMKQHEQNAMSVARFLSKHPKVEKVIYPGLENHPQHALASQQMSGFGGMISFVVKGDLDSAKRVMERTRVFTLAESLGGVESLIELPAIMTHASVPQEQRQSLGISDSLIRISVGIEDEQDLIDDLTQALA